MVLVRAADPDRLLGWVTEVLPYGLRLARFFPKGENCELKEAEFAFVAAAHEVRMDVQQAIRKLQPQLQTESEVTWVTFQVESKPGLREAEGAGRAKSVFLATCPSTEESEEPVSVQSAQAPKVPKVCSVMIPAVAQWQRLVRAQPQKMDDAFRKLAHRTQQALAVPNADELAQAVVQISAGICATEMSCSQLVADGVPRSAEQDGLRHLRPWVEKLVCLANLGLSGLMKDDRYRGRQNPCFLPALLLCRQLVWQRRKPLPRSWLELQKWVNLGLRQPQSKPWACSADGCDALAAGRVEHADNFGPAGWRCVKHGARRCNVESCKRFARALVRLQDSNGVLTNMGQQAIAASCMEGGAACLDAENMLGDVLKRQTATGQLGEDAGSMEERIWDELSRGGVCGFSPLHFAAFAGKAKSCQALIDLGVNVNAKTQPLCVTPSQQFCRPTPLDLTIFIPSKRSREQVQRVLQAADASYGGVKMESLDKLWQGLMKHQLLLIKDEVLKYTKKIPAALRRILRTEPRWRELVNFPGEDAATMERKRLRKAFVVWRCKLTWVLIGDATMILKERCAVLAWNCFLFVASWWLFSFHLFELLQALLVAIVLMMVSSLVRGTDPQTVWARLPSQEDLKSWLPPEDQFELHLQKAWARLCGCLSLVEAALDQAPSEAEKLREAGLFAYLTAARDRYDTWRSLDAEEKEEPEEQEEDHASDSRRKKSAAIANKIRGLKAEREGAATSAAAASSANQATGFFGTWLTSVEKWGQDVWTGLWANHAPGAGGLIEDSFMGLLSAVSLFSLFQMAFLKRKSNSFSGLMHTATGAMQIGVVLYAIVEERCLRESPGVLWAISTWIIFMVNNITMWPLLKYFRGPEVQRVLFKLAYSFIISFQGIHAIAWSYQYPWLYWV
ncbi:unnamed protein product, partial [Symbiodinium necroappetens]